MCIAARMAETREVQRTVARLSAWVIEGPPFVFARWHVISCSARDHHLCFAGLLSLFKLVPVGSLKSTRQVAAWHWLHEGCGLDIAAGQPARVRFDSALFARLMFCGMVVRQTTSEQVFASLGHGSWAALVWPLKEISRDEVAGRACFDIGIQLAGALRVLWPHLIPCRRLVLPQC